MEDIEDLSWLTFINETSVLNILKKRFSNGKIYTSAGSILLSLNPFTMLNQYSKEVMNCYIQLLKKDLEFSSSRTLNPLDQSHLYRIANHAVKNLYKKNLEINLENNQTIIITGESGAGKTESTRLLMEYFSYTSAKGCIFSPNKSGEIIRLRILESNPLLEAFGNAKTERNMNSSRFGKFIKLQFSKDVGIVGATITCCLLETTRVVSQAFGETNFHIFYHLCDGANEEMKKQLFLRNSCDFNFLLNNEMEKEDSLLISSKTDNKEKLIRIIQSMNSIGFTNDEQNNIFLILSGILHLGEISFEEDDNDKIEKRRNLNIYTIISKCFGIDVQFIEYICSKTTITAGKDVINVELTKEQGKIIRSSLAKEIYSNLFKWILNKLNNSISSNKEKTGFIGLVDLFGFEILKQNGLEQLCINYANEQLQCLFLDLFIHNEQETYKTEEIIFTLFEIQKNKQEQLMIFDSKPFGIFNLLDEECSIPRGNSKKFLEKLYYSNKKNEEQKGKREKLKEVFYMNPLLLSKGCFTIRHYAGNVEYYVEDFCQKNKEQLSIQIMEVFTISKNTILKEMIKQQHKNLLLKEQNKVLKEQRKNSTNNKIIKSVVSQFKNELKDLLETISTTQVQFIRCIKTNTICQPNFFDTKVVENQILRTGLVDVMRVARNGYSIKLSHKKVLKKYHLLLPYNKRIIKEKKTRKDSINKNNKNKNQQENSRSLTEEFLWEIVRIYRIAASQYAQFPNVLDNSSNLVRQLEKEINLEITWDKPEELEINLESNWSKDSIHDKEVTKEINNESEYIMVTSNKIPFNDLLEIAGCQVGKSKVFFKDWCFDTLERLLTSKVTRIITKFQKFIKSYIKRKKRESLAIRNKIHTFFTAVIKISKWKKNILKMRKVKKRRLYWEAVIQEFKENEYKHTKLKAALKIVRWWTKRLKLKKENVLTVVSTRKRLLTQYGSNKSLMWKVRNQLLLLHLKNNSANRYTFEYEFFLSIMKNPFILGSKILSNFLIKRSSSLLISNRELHVIPRQDLFLYSNSRVILLAAICLQLFLFKVKKKETGVILLLYSKEYYAARTIQSLLVCYLPRKRFLKLRKSAKLLSLWVKKRILLKRKKKNILQTNSTLLYSCCKDQIILIQCLIRRYLAKKQFLRRRKSAKILLFWAKRLIFLGHICEDIADHRIPSGISQVKKLIQHGSERTTLESDNDKYSNILFATMDLIYLVYNDIKNETIDEMLLDIADKTIQKPLYNFVNASSITSEMKLFVDSSYLWKKGNLGIRFQFNEKLNHPFIDSIQKKSVFGFKEGDLLVRINNISTRGMNCFKCVHLLTTTPKPLTLHFQTLNENGEIKIANDDKINNQTKVENLEQEVKDYHQVSSKLITRKDIINNQTKVEHLEPEVNDYLQDPSNLITKNEEHFSSKNPFIFSTFKERKQNENYKEDVTRDLTSTCTEYKKETRNDNLSNKINKKDKKSNEDKSKEHSPQSIKTMNQKKRKIQPNSSISLQTTKEFLTLKEQEISSRELFLLSNKNKKYKRRIKLLNGNILNNYESNSIQSIHAIYKDKLVSNDSMENQKEDVLEIDLYSNIQSYKNDKHNKVVSKFISSKERKQKNIKIYKNKLLILSNKTQQNEEDLEDYGFFKRKQKENNLILDLSRTKEYIKKEKRNIDLRKELFHITNSAILQEHQNEVIFDLLSFKNEDEDKQRKNETSNINKEIKDIKEIKENEFPALTLFPDNEKENKDLSIALPSISKIIEYKDEKVILDLNLSLNHKENKKDEEQKKDENLELSLYSIEQRQNKVKDDLTKVTKHLAEMVEDLSLDLQNYKKQKSVYEVLWYQGQLGISFCKTSYCEFPQVVRVGNIFDFPLNEIFKVSIGDYLIAIGRECLTHKDFNSCIRLLVESTKPVLLLFASYENKLLSSNIPKQHRILKEDEYEYKWEKAEQLIFTIKQDHSVGVPLVADVGFPKTSKEKKIKYQEQKEQNNEPRIHQQQQQQQKVNKPKCIISIGDHLIFINQYATYGLDFSMILHLLRHAKKPASLIFKKNNLKEQQSIKANKTT